MANFLSEALAGYKELMAAKKSKKKSKKLDKKLVNKLLSNKKGTGLLNTNVSQSIKHERDRIYRKKLKELIKDRDYKGATELRKKERKKFLDV